MVAVISETIADLLVNQGLESFIARIFMMVPDIVATQKNVLFCRRIVTSGWKIL